MSGPPGHLPRSRRVVLADASGDENRAACSSIGSTLALSGRESDRGLCQLFPGIATGLLRESLEVKSAVRAPTCRARVFSFNRILSAAGTRALHVSPLASLGLTGP